MSVQVKQSVALRLLGSFQQGRGQDPGGDPGHPQALLGRGGEVRRLKGDGTEVLVTRAWDEPAFMARRAVT